MKIILSPAKKMITDTDSIAPDGLPEFIEKTTESVFHLMGISTCCKSHKLMSKTDCEDRNFRII